MEPILFRRLLLVGALAAFTLAPAARAEWPANANDVVSVATGPGDAVLSHVAPDGLGGMLIVWTDDDAGNDDVFAQRVDLDGTPLWGSNGVSVCAAAGNQVDPQITDDGTGGAIITWTDERNAGSTQLDVYAQRIQADGTAAWTSDGIPVCDQFNNQLEPRIASDGAGGAYLVWKDSRTGQARVWGQRLDPSGAGVWTDDGIDFSPGDIVDGIEMVSDDAGGAWVVWDEVTGSRYALQHVNPDGTFQMPVGGHTVLLYFPDHSLPSICSDGFGGCWVGSTYFDDFILQDHHYVNHYSATNQSLGFGQVGAGSTTEVRIAPDGLGGVVLASPNSFDVYVSRVDANGLILYEQVVLDVPLSGGGEYRWALVPDFVGGAMVAIRDFTGGVQGIHIAPDGSLPWGDGNPTALKLAVQGSVHPYAVHDSDNGMLVAWSNDDVWAARADRHGYVGLPRALVTGADDIPGDQGGSILTSWDASPLDAFPNEVITHYVAWRQAGNVPRSAPEAGPAAVDESLLALAEALDVESSHARRLLRAGWEPVGSVPAAYQESYAFETATYADSTEQGAAPMNVRVFAHTASPFVFWESNMLTGQSIDNLAPGAPLNANVAQSGINTLTWEAPYAPDLAFYRVYRGLTPDFAADASSFLAATTELEWVDLSGGAEHFYKITAVDDAWNESEPASPGVTVDAPEAAGAVPARFALHGAAPNPFNPRTTIRFDLAADALRATLRVYDAAGRLVRVLVDSALPAGVHRAAWDGRDDAGRAVASGLYYAELVAGERSERRRMVMLK